METTVVQGSREDAVNRHFCRRSEYWDSLYNSQKDYQVLMKYELKRRKDIVFDIIGEAPYDTLSSALDLGCGSGQYLPRLFQLGYDCYAADISEEMLQLARKKLPSADAVKWIHSDCRQVPVADHVFDLILCVGVLEYLEDDITALREMGRLIKPDGRVIVTVPNMYKLRNLLNPYYYLVRVWTYFLKKQPNRTASEKSPHPDQRIEFCKSNVRRYRRSGIKKKAEQAGFRIITVRSCFFGPFSLWKRALFPLNVSRKLSNALERLSATKLFGFLNCFANRWVMLLQPETAGSAQPTHVWRRD